MNAEQTQKGYQEQKMIKLKEATIIAAFPDAGMVGSITANYIIEQLHMHQIAFVDSEFIIPGIIYIGVSSDTHSASMQIMTALSASFSVKYP